MVRQQLAVRAQQPTASMVMPACCCMMLSCKHVLRYTAIPAHVIIPISIFAVTFNSIAPTAIISISHITLPCKQPLQAFAAAAAPNQASAPLKP
jgi:hypothetical protein